MRRGILFPVLSASTEKTARREIRRAFGPEAIEILNRQKEALDFISAAVTGSEQRMTLLDGQVSDAHARLSESEDAHARIVESERVMHDCLGTIGLAVNDLVALSKRGFFARLQWLMTGK